MNINASDRWHPCDLNETTDNARGYVRSSEKQPNTVSQSVHHKHVRDTAYDTLATSYSQHYVLFDVCRVDAQAHGMPPMSVLLTLAPAFR